MRGGWADWLDDADWPGADESGAQQATGHRGAAAAATATVTSPLYPL